jgi:hypothetical protein
MTFSIVNSLGNLKCASATWKWQRQQANRAQKKAGLRPAFNQIIPTLYAT